MAYDTVFHLAVGGTATPNDLWDYIPVLIKAAAQGDRSTYDRWLPLLEAFEAGACRLYLATDKVYVVTPPQVVHTDGQGRLHCVDGPAFVWQDVEMYYWHGVLAPKAVRRFLSRQEWRQITGCMSTGPIDKLTPEQEALLPDYAAKWETIRRSTAPADRVRAEEGVRLTYAAARLQPPKEIIWLPSPYAIALAYRQVFPPPDLATHVTDVMIHMKVLLCDWDFAALADDVHETLRQALTTSVNFSEYIYFGLPPRERQFWRVLNSVPKKVYEEYGPDIYSHRHYGQRDPFDLLYGQHDNFHMARRDYCREVLGQVGETELMRGPLLVAQSANWWLPCEEICWISDRPRRIQFDTRNRLHREDGPAIEYRDGWGVYCWRGIIVPERIILRPETISIEEIDKATNIEFRRVLLENYGEARYIKASGAEVIHEDEYGTLYRREFSDDEPLVMVRVRNSTPEPDGSYKPYWLRVPPTMRTAHQAVAWTFGLTPDQYRPQIES